MCGKGGAGRSDGGFTRDHYARNRIRARAAQAIGRRRGAIIRFPVVRLSFIVSAGTNQVLARRRAQRGGCGGGCYSLRLKDLATETLRMQSHARDHDFRHPYGV